MKKRFDQADETLLLIEEELREEEVVSREEMQETDIKTLLDRTSSRSQFQKKSPLE